MSHKFFPSNNVWCNLDHSGEKIYLDLLSSLAQPQLDSHLWIENVWNLNVLPLSAYIHFWNYDFSTKKIIFFICFFLAIKSTSESFISGKFLSSDNCLLPTLIIFQRKTKIFNFPRRIISFLILILNIIRGGIKKLSQHLKVPGNERFTFNKNAPQISALNS